MNKSEIVSEIRNIVIALVDDSTVAIGEDSSLVGSNGIIDSLDLVDLCVKLEDFANSLGFEFDWTSELAMSKSRGIFRSIENLSDEFYQQMQNKK